IVGRSRPVKLVAHFDVLLGMQMKPATAASFPRPRIVGEGERLEMPVADVDQVLLQGLDAERVLDLVRLLAPSRVSAFAPDAERFDLVARARAPKAGGLSEVAKGLVVEVSEHRFRRRDLRREAMMRRLPGRVRLDVTGLAALRTHVLGFRCALERRVSGSRGRGHGRAVRTSGATSVLAYAKSGDRQEPRKRPTAAPRGSVPPGP